MELRHAVPAAAACVLLLAACGQTEAQRRAAQASSAMAAIAADASWVPAGMKSVGDVAWKWTEDGLVECKSYQDRCFGVTVSPRYACPGGIYIEVAVLDGGVVVDKANEITAGLGSGQTARAVLSPPGGAKRGAKAQLSDLNCLS